MNYSINEIARLFGNTVGAVRFYEEEGLIKPARNESGKRVYTEENIFELFYLRKYCNFGMTIKEIMSSFHYQNNNMIEDIQACLEQKKIEAEHMARYYESSAKWIADYNDRIAHLDHYTTHLEQIDAPTYYAIAQDDFLSKDKRKQALTQKWIAQMPLSRISTIRCYEGDVQSSSTTALIISKEDAELSCLEVPDYALTMKPCRCLYTILHVQNENFGPLASSLFTQKLSDAAARAYPHSSIAISNMFFTHNMDGQQYQYYELFIPLGLTDGIWDKK